MENTFNEYYPNSPSIIEELWGNAIFVFDTNILCNLYRYSDETSSMFIDTIKKLDSIWIPHQVGKEFFRNRLSVISDQKKSYEDLEKKIVEIINLIEDKNRNPFFSPNLVSKLTAIKEEIKVEVTRKKEYYDNSLIEDKLLTEITQIFAGKVGAPQTPEQLKSIFVEGEKRYAENIPPGFKDKAKQNNDKFGDLILWKEMLSKSEFTNKDLIFICDDRKDDWWLDHHGRTISPRPELLKEFTSKTGRKCHFYKPFQFLEFANQYLLNSSIKIETIEEVKYYKPNDSQLFDTILFDITLKGDDDNINEFISDLKQTGYKIFKDNYISKDIRNIVITLPKISDLERRLTEKYINNLSKYNLELIGMIKE